MISNNLEEIYLNDFFFFIGLVFYYLNFCYGISTTYKFYQNTYYLLAYGTLYILPFKKKI